MQFYLMRHGIAKDVGEDGIARDAERPLSAEGRRKTADVAQALRKLGVKVTMVGSSPMLRAMETARLIAAGLNVKDVTVCEFLEPSGSARECLSWLRSFGAADSVLAVGHMPDVSEIASYLLSGQATLSIAFKKASVCCLVFDQAPAAGNARLEWHMQPAQLRALVE